MAFDENALPPLPYKTPVINERGFLTEPWAKLFRQLWVRVGGSIALTNLELEELQEADLVTITSDITALQASVTTINTSLATVNTSLASLASDIQGLNEGRQL